MLYEEKKIAMDLHYLVVIFVLAMVFFYFLGYVTFRYWKIDVCKSVVEISRND